LRSLRANHSPAEYLLLKQSISRFRKRFVYSPTTNALNTSFGQILNADRLSQGSGRASVQFLDIPTPLFEDGG
jgi:hypothetical protein